jgi:hypothetical protein
MEQLNLTIPDVKTIATWRVVRLEFDWEQGQILVVLVGTNGVRRTYGYVDNEIGTPATNFLRALNTMNLSVKSLHRRILERLVLDHPELGGSIGGLPD